MPRSNPANYYEYFFMLCIIVANNRLDKSELSSIFLQECEGPNPKPARHIVIDLQLEEKEKYKDLRSGSSRSSNLLMALRPSS